jgi:hypothetical protein
MIALIVSFYLVVYLLVPRVIFRFSDLFVPLKFQRTRTQEITSAVSISLIPLAAAIVLALTVRGWPSSETRSDYREVFAGAYSEPIFAIDYDAFWSSVARIVSQQVEFVPIYYVFVAIEASIFVTLVTHYGDWRKYRLYELFAQRFLLRRINELHMLFTVFNFPRLPELKVVVDLLTQEDHLYQGDVVEYFVDTDGALSSLSLENVLRFDRVGYLRDKKGNAATQPESYWKPIPGSVLYVPSAKILSLNLRYEPAQKADATIDAEIANKELAQSGKSLKIEISELPPEPASQTSKP